MTTRRSMLLGGAAAGLLPQGEYFHPGGYGAKASGSELDLREARLMSSRYMDERSRDTGAVYFSDFATAAGDDESQQLQAAIDATPNGGMLYGVGGSVYYASGLIVQNKSITIDLQGGAIVAPPGSVAKNVLTLRGEFGHNFAVDVSSAVAGETWVTSLAGAQRIEPEMWIKVVSDDLAPQVGHSFQVRLGHALKVKHVEGSMIRCFGSVPFLPLYRTNVRAAAYSTSRCIVQNGLLVGSDISEPPLPKHHILVFDSLVRPEAQSVRVARGSQPGIVFRSTVLARSVFCDGSDLGSSLGVVVASQNSYATSILAPRGVSVRHLADANSNSLPQLSDADIGGYGQDTDFKCINGEVVAATTSALTVHSPARGATWIGQRVSNSARVIGVRGDGSRWSDITASDCVTAIQVVTPSQNCTIENFRFTNIEEQALVQSGPLHGLCTIRNGIFECSLRDKPSMVVPIIAADGRLEIKDVELKFIGQAGAKKFIDAFGTGQLVLNNVTFDLTEAEGNTEFCLISVSDKIKSITGRNNRVIGGKNTRIKSAVEIGKSSDTIVDVEIRGENIECDAPLTNNSSRLDGIHLIYTFVSDGASCSSSSRVINIENHEEKIYHNSADPVVILLVNASPARSLSIASGHHIGQLCIVENAASEATSVMVQHKLIPRGARLAFVWTGKHWAKLGLSTSSG